MHFSSGFGLLIFLTGGVGLVVGPLLAGVYGLLGARVGVFERTDGLVVRNRYATRRVPWDEISGLDFRDREPRFGMDERRCGAVWLVHRTPV